MPACCPYLHFDGTANEALQLYQRVLGGELNLMTYGQMPPGQGDPPPGFGPVDPGRVMHGELTFEGGKLMASDAPNASMVEPVTGFSVAIVLSTEADGRRAFDMLADGAAEIRMPYGPTFWAKGFGMLKDRYGTPWIINGGMVTA